jgi:hypothetical protein
MDFDLSSEERKRYDSIVTGSGAVGVALTRALWRAVAEHLARLLAQLAPPLQESADQFLMSLLAGAGGRAALRI